MAFTMIILSNITVSHFKSCALSTQWDMVPLHNTDELFILEASFCSAYPACRDSVAWDRAQCQTIVPVMSRLSVSYYSSANLVSVPGLQYTALHICPFVCLCVNVLFCVSVNPCITLRLCSMSLYIICRAHCVKHILITTTYFVVIKMCFTVCTYSAESFIICNLLISHVARLQYTHVNMVDVCTFVLGFRIGSVISLTVVLCLVGLSCSYIRKPSLEPYSKTPIK